MSSTRHSQNAPGPFYVIHGLCIYCTAPEAEAPDLIAHEEPEYHCYFRKQPSTPEEMERAIRAVAVSCCGAVRYGGNDPDILQRIKEWNPEACDH
jgi:hypothetical protein